MDICTYAGKFGCSLGRKTGQCLYPGGLIVPRISETMKNTLILQPCGYIPRQQARDILKAVGGNKPIYLPDGMVAIYNKNEVASFLDLCPISEISYIPDTHDCDDFAVELFYIFAGLVWTNLHALNWFIDENLKFWYIEPQNDTIADGLLAWQGDQISFFLSRR